MTTRRTPFEGIRYPWSSDVVDVADVQALASDVDQALVQTANLANNFSKFSSVTVQRQGAAQSVAKGSLVTITFDTVVLNNGANSPLANGSWYSSGAPTRVTAPSACVVVASAMAGMNFSTTLGTAGCLQVAITLNGSASSSSGNMQGTKFSPLSSGQTWASAVSMWKLAAGDYLELKVYWTGTPAGPFNTDNVLYPTLSLAMAALPSVA